MRRARKPGIGGRKLEKDAEGRGMCRGGRAVFMVVEKAARLVRASFLLSGGCHINPRVKHHDRNYINLPHLNSQTWSKPAKRP
jgi:hypothetical protein